MDSVMDATEASPSGLTSYNLSDLTSSTLTVGRSDLVGNVTFSSCVISEANSQGIIINAVIMAFTVIGNMTLILALLCKRSRRIKRVNILILNLAFGDLAIAIFVNVTEILFLAFDDWALGPVVCKITVYVQVIVKPMQSLARRPRIWLKIAIAWTLSLIFTIPQLFIFVQYNDGHKYDGTPKRVCGSKGYTAPWQRKVNFTFTTMYILIVPMTIMLYCYVHIIRVVWIRANSETRGRSSCYTPPPGHVTSPPAASFDEKEGCRNENSDVGCGCDMVTPGKGRGVVSNNRVTWAKSVKDNRGKNEHSQSKVKKQKLVALNQDELNAGSPRMSIRRSLVTASKRRALIMTLTVVLSFLFCQMPYFFVNLVRIYSDYNVELKTLKPITEFMVLVHSTLNPLLYGMFALRQNHLKYVIAFLTCSSPPAPPATIRNLKKRQYSDERNKLLNTVRSGIPQQDSNNSNVSSSPVDNAVADRKLQQHKHAASEVIAATSAPSSRPKSSTLPPSSPTASSTSLLTKLRFKPLPQFHLRGKKKKHCQDPLLFSNLDAIHMTQHSPLSPGDSELSSAPREASSITLIPNTHILKNNGVSSPSHPTNHKAALGCEVRPLSRSQGGREVVKGVTIIPWSPQDDEFIIGGLTRV